MTRPPAAARVTAALLAAAWRENLHGLRQRAHIQPATQHTHITVTIDTPSGPLRTTAHPGTYDQLTPTGPIHLHHDPITDPTRLLAILAPGHHPQLAAELTDAATGLATAIPRHHRHTTDLATTATTLGAHSLIALAQHKATTEPEFTPCRFFEPLAVDGHHLHPCARTRLGWNHTDRINYDLETTRPITMRFVAAHRTAVDTALDTHGHDLGRLLEHLHPPLREHHHPDRTIIALHPWQHRHLHTGPARDLYHDGTLTDLPTTLPAHPTASIRTLVTDDGHYLKCSLSIHITSTSRGISPATVHNGPVLTRLLRRLIADDDYLAPRLTFLAEPAGTALPHGHPAARDLSCLLRTPLTDVTTTTELPVPATALPATSPVTGTSIATELQTASGLTAPDFLHRYTLTLAGPVLRLAAEYGIGTEAHLQNCVPTFINGTPHRIVLRDLGGCRINLHKLHHTGHRPDLHPASVITADTATVNAKVAYTVFQNHLSAIVDALATDGTLTPDTGWQAITEAVANLRLPQHDRDFHTAATVPHKALLSMRLDPGHDIHVPVTNPLART